MIRKYMVCGKQIYVGSSKRDFPDKAEVIELSLPIETFWEIEEILQRCDYMIASGDDQVQIEDLYRDIYKKVQKYVVSEKDRIRIHERINK